MSKVYSVLDGDTGVGVTLNNNGEFTILTKNSVYSCNSYMGLLALLSRLKSGHNVPSELIDQIRHELENGKTTDG